MENSPPSEDPLRGGPTLAAGLARISWEFTVVVFLRQEGSSALLVQVFFFLEYYINFLFLPPSPSLSGYVSLRISFIFYFLRAG